MDLRERDETKVEPLHRGSDAWIAERADLLGAFISVPGLQTVGVARMAAELDDVVPQLLQQPDQRLGRDGVGIRTAVPRVSVEVATEADLRIDASERDAESVGGVHEDRSESGRPVDMMMRVEMRRVTADQAPKALELPFERRRGVFRRDRSRLPSPPAKPWTPRGSELDVEPDREPCLFARVRGGLGGRARVHHQARTRDDPVLMRLDDPPVDALAEAEVVGVHDQQSARLHFVKYPRRTSCAVRRPG